MPITETAGHIGSGQPIEQLERDVAAFEQRLWQVLVAARFLLPVAILLSLTTASLGRSFHQTGTLVWALLALWTGATTRYVWSHLERLRGLPWPFRVETAVLVGLLFAGLGTREWHIVHSAIPLIFCAVFVSVPATLVVTVALTAALWATRVPSLLGWSTQIEPPLGSATPSAVYVITAITLLFVRQLLADVRRIAAEQRKADDSLAATRRLNIRRQEIAATNRQFVQSVAALLNGITAEAGMAVKDLLSDPELRAGRLVKACNNAETTLRTLSFDTEQSARTSPAEEPSSIRFELKTIFEQFENLDLKPLQLDLQQMQRDVELIPDHIAPFRRRISRGAPKRSQAWRAPDHRQRQLKRQSLGRGHKQRYDSNHAPRGTRGTRQSRRRRKRPRRRAPLHPRKRQSRPENRSPINPRRTPSTRSPRAP